MKSVAVFLYNAATKGGRFMRRFLMALTIGILAVAVAQEISQAQTPKSSPPKASESQYEVLNPWAEVDPIPLRGISPRVESLAGKKIGLFANFKRAAVPITESVQKRLGGMYTDASFSTYHSTLPNVNEAETKNRDKFIAWIKSVDTIVAVVGD
jgi:hypothetical protein